ncbi:MAG: translation initiation factor IF-2 [Bradymonadia bacterium]|jgi:translation initiation factor IF-2
MSKRLYEIARDLGISSTDLSDRIDGLTLTFEIQNHLSVLDEGQVDELVGALQTTPKAERVQKKMTSGLIRRRTRRKANEDLPASADGIEAPVETPAEVVAEAEPEEAPAPAPAPAQAAEPAVAAPPARRQKMATVVTRPQEPKPEKVPVAAAPEPFVEAPAPEPAVAEAVEPVAEPAPAAPKRRFATLHTRDLGPSAPPPNVDEPAPAEKARSKFATVHTRSNPSVRTTAPSAAEMARISVAAPTRSATAGGAKVVGTINPELLNNRLEADKKDFGPRSATDGAGRTKKKGKRVVQSREIYGGRRPGRGKKRSKHSAPQPTQITTAAAHKRVVRMEESILVGDLAMQMSVKAGELAMKLMFELGIRGANINTAVDFDTAQLIAEMFQHTVEQVGFDIQKFLPKFDVDEDTAETRPPVVTVMGHVDHGKTSLLDAIRNEAVASGEAGGITQHIGAYQVKLDGGTVTLLDTPGHEAFTALRARGAKATDIAILVVAADDGPMPQTVEAINHAKEAGVPIIVAVNKCDKPGANPDRVRQALAPYELIPEAWGGTTIFVECSALTGKGVDTLLEMIHLQAELMELKATTDRPAVGLVIESKLDVGRGPVASVLVQDGTLRNGDIVVVGEYYGRVRTMMNEHGDLLKEAGPAVPVEVTGMNGVPAAGETFHVVEDSDKAKTIADHIGASLRQSELALSASPAGGADALDIFAKSGEIKQLKIVLKGDVQGSVEALSSALQQLSTDKVAVRIIHSGVGKISESDVNLAASSEEGVRALVIGFNIKPDNRAQALADQFNVTMVLESVIYEIIDRVRIAMTSMLEPVFEEKTVGRAEVRATFGVPRVGQVAGCMVTEGLLLRKGKIRVFRGEAIIHNANVGSLRHFEQNVPDVKAGFECGISVHGYDEIEIGDILECYKLVEMQATL